VAGPLGQHEAVPSKLERGDHVGDLAVALLVGGQVA
jgi:hypothetical protein